jgi:NAD(P)-dependent dehydrogenase (short-subunit alcohol dehydrogenase family)
MTKRNFTNKVALVTGGGGQFGRVMCQTLAQRGCKLIVGDCDLTAARDTAARTAGLALGLDVTDPAMWTNTASAARDLFGPLDYVFHCAQQGAEGSDVESLARLWAIQVSSLELAYWTCGPELDATGGVHVVFVSGAAWQPDPTRPLWSAAEAAKRQWYKAHQLGSSRLKNVLIAYDVPPRPARKTTDDEIAAATLWALSRGQTQAFVPGGFGVAGFCRKAAQ